jgi:hypothetical protein
MDANPDFGADCESELVKHFARSTTQQQANKACEILNNQPPPNAAITHAPPIQLAHLPTFQG